MPLTTKAKLGAYRVAQFLRIVPNIWMMRNPLKIYEYAKVTHGMDLRPDHSILDLGCGKGFQTQVLARKSLKATGCDTSTKQIESANRFLQNSSVKNKVNFYCGQIEQLNLPAASFDRVFSFCVLEHIQNLSEVLLELHRLMKPNAELHASVDALENITDSALIERHRKDHFVVQYFTPDTLRKQLENAGFDVKDIFPIMTGNFAREQFEKRIQLSDFSFALPARYRFYKKLCAEEPNSGSRKGIMLVVRATRRG